jgi:hypothetical protein
MTFICLSKIKTKAAFSNSFSYRYINSMYNVCTVQYIVYAVIVVRDAINSQNYRFMIKNELPTFQNINDVNMTSTLKTN